LWSRYWKLSTFPISFFSELSKARREHQMVSQDLPLLYGILMGVLTGGNNVAKEDNNPTSTPASKLPANIPRDPFEAQLLDREGTAYIPAPHADNHWAHHVRAVFKC
jgi:hypothetical protein